MFPPHYDFLTRSAKPLRYSRSVAAVLETAMRFEQSVQAAYGELSLRVCEEVRPLVRQLAWEADAQLRHLRALPRSNQGDDHDHACPKRSPGCSELAEPDGLPALPDNALDDDVLEYAMGVEHTALEHYGYLFDLTPDGPVKAMLAHLAATKQERIRILERRWAVLFSVF